MVFKVEGFGLRVRMYMYIDIYTHVTIVYNHALRRSQTMTIVCICTMRSSKGTLEGLLPWPGYGPALWIPHQPRGRQHPGAGRPAAREQDDTKRKWELLYQGIY